MYPKIPPLEEVIWYMAWGQHMNVVFNAKPTTTKSNPWLQSTCSWNFTMSSLDDRAFLLCKSTNTNLYSCKQYFQSFCLSAFLMSSTNSMRRSMFSIMALVRLLSNEMVSTALLLESFGHSHWVGLSGTPHILVMLMSLIVLRKDSIQCFLLATLPSINSFLAFSRPISKILVKILSPTLFSRCSMHGRVFVRTNNASSDPTRPRYVRLLLCSLKVNSSLSEFLRRSHLSRIEPVGERPWSIKSVVIFLAKVITSGEAVDPEVLVALSISKWLAFTLHLEVLEAAGVMDRSSSAVIQD